MPLTAVLIERVPKVALYRRKRTRLKKCIWDLYITAFVRNVFHWQHSETANFCPQPSSQINRSDCS